MGRSQAGDSIQGVDGYWIRSDRENIWMRIEMEMWK